MNRTMGKNLDKLNTEELGTLFPVVISDPDPDWPKQFETEKKRIKDVLDSKSSCIFTTLAVLQSLI
ncbi:MAG: hypothetical protein JXB19_03210 [Bacteroidales bacterium]|nr:hypothetical protein [Bacteroidales bacterium]